ncbi:MAG: phosphoenolpyruvate synthase, partial [Actinotalea sp.]|nr:phosphoenolpyruvate synthase [Actinotalea sp.]
MEDVLCIPLAALSRDDVELAGGKGANLGELVRGGFDVPGGFVVTTRAHRLVDAGGLPPTAAEIEAWVVPDEVAEAVADAYRRLGGGPVAVRSSATAEDLPGAAFAGQHDTFLNVVGADDVVDAVRRCWASLWTERAVGYRERLGTAPAGVAVAVVVQRLVPADHAGVALTANPVTGDRTQVVIDSSPGLGEAVVSGLVTPDHAVLDAAGRVVERRQGRREVVISARTDGGGTQAQSGAAGTAVPRLGDAELRRVAELARRVARHFGRPQDIEWALHGGRLHVLQARPMTALPPAPVPLDAVQRRIGPTLLELFPRRPYPMELSAWIRPTVGTHVERMLGGLTGVVVRFDDVVPSVDDVVQAFVPPRPRPTTRTPAHLWWSAHRGARLAAADWRSDGRYRRYRDGVAAMGATGPAGLAWRALVSVPARAAELVDLMTGVRVTYLPTTAVALLRLRVLLGVLRLGPLFADLVLHAPTVTKAANDALSELAAHVRDAPGLAAALAGRKPEDAVRIVATAPEAAGLRDRLQEFTATYGHRETSSLLLVRDPTWGDSPATVLSLVLVLLDQDPARPAGRAGTRRALGTLTGHPLVRLTRSQRRVTRVVRAAAAGVALREDTHFELTRLMPAVRGAVVEIGRRLERGGSLDDVDDVWMLTTGDVVGLHDPGTAQVPVDLRPVSRRRRAAWAELAGSPLIARSTLYPIDPRRAAGPDVLVTGVGGGSGTATGTARVIRGVEEFATLRPGEVLVCSSTNPSWTPLFQRAAAVVVDNGGPASHAAIVAREYGVPAVMGTAV